MSYTGLLALGVGVGVGGWGGGGALDLAWFYELDTLKKCNLTAIFQYS